MTNRNIFFWVMFFKCICYGITQASSYNCVRFVGHNTLLESKSVDPRNDDYKQILLKVQRYFKVSSAVEYNKIWPNKHLNILVPFFSIKKLDETTTSQRFPGLTWLQGKIKKNIHNNKKDVQKKLSIVYDLDRSFSENSITYTLSKTLLSFVIDYNNAFYFKKNIIVSDRQRDQISEYNEKIMAFLNFVENNCNTIDINAVERIIYANVADLKFSYIENSFLDFVPLDFHENLHCYINNLEVYSEPLVTIWKKFVIKNLITDENKGWIEEKCKQIDACVIDQKLKKIVRLSYKLMEERNLFTFMFKDIVTIDPFNKNFFIELKNNLLKNENLIFVTRVKEQFPIKQMLEDILNKDELVTQRDKLKLTKDKFQLLNARTFIFLHSLIKYANFLFCDQDLYDYYNKFHLLYEQSVIEPKNILIANGCERNFPQTNLFDYINTIEAIYLPSLLKADSKEKYLYDYTKYINYLIWPLLKKNLLAYEKNIIKQFEAASLAAQLCKLIEWEKNNFKKLQFSYNVNRYDEYLMQKLQEAGCKKERFVEDIKFIHQSKEYNTIITTIKNRFEDGLTAQSMYDDCIEQGLTSRFMYPAVAQCQMIYYCIKIIGFMAEKMPDNLQSYYNEIAINHTESLSSIECHAYSLYTNYIRPAYDNQKNAIISTLDKLKIEKIFHCICEIKKSSVARTLDQ